MIDWFLQPLKPWDALPWLTMCPLEIIATVFGLWSVACYVRESVWAWPTGLINVLLFIVLFYQWGLFAETGLQVVFVGLQIYGWWQWLRGGERHQGVVITRTSAREWMVLGGLAVIAAIPIGLLLDHKTTSTVPWWDTIPTVLSLVAQWMISHKKLENWLVWIVVDLISIPLFAYKELYLTAALYGVFLILCCFGLRAWLTTWRAAKMPAGATP
jgi:nicotinamide mononucleotide transporter